MANIDAPMGFSLIKTGGHSPVRRKRTVLVGNTRRIASGDAYTILADGSVTSCDGNTTPNGVVEGIELQGVDQGPVSYAYLPAGVAGNVIGIEDPTAEFEVQCTAALALSDFDAGAKVNVDGAGAAPECNTTLAQSRQEVGDVGGSQFMLVGVVDTPNNDLTLVNSKVIVRLVSDNVQ